MLRWENEAAGLPDVCMEEDHTTSFAVRWQGLKHTVSEAGSIFSQHQHKKFGMYLARCNA